MDKISPIRILDAYDKTTNHTNQDQALKFGPLWQILLGRSGENMQFPIVVCQIDNDDITATKWKYKTS